MGIPAFYRWLSGKYPLAVVNVLEEHPEVVNAQTIPVDSSKPNPNGIEYHNLYLDMNNIIHPCFHPENQAAPKNYEEVFVSIFKYIDRIFSIVRPRKLLFMAIDGVAPRAKMNQQRARRFRAAKDAADAAAETEKLRHELQRVGEELVLPVQTVLDSNVITPGTEFMAALSLALQYYIHIRLNNDPGWHGLKIILSDANVPGEGEHKIMSYIRLQRNLPGFDPNTKHCLYGLDADLIMLALATHEVHFSILREDIFALRENEKNRDHCPEQDNIKGEGLPVPENYLMKLKFQFLHIWVLRDYLKHDLKISDSSVKAELERLIDDFVFMCLFVGNDFLPHIPSLEISEGAIDLLMAIYKKEFSRMGGYLTNSFEVDLERVEHFIQAVGSHENAIFKRRNQVQRERDIRDRKMLNIKLGRTGSSGKTSGNFWSSLNQLDTPNSQTPKKQLDIDNASSNGSNGMALNALEHHPVDDKIRLGEEGWKERYYDEKFGVETEDDVKRVRKHAVLKYTEGICWVMHYYYNGVCSWQWFYPYHYAPFASDFYGLENLEIRFSLGFPFKPFDQLMGVLPAASAHALPLFYRRLMTDSSSPIADFYPSDFLLDMNGKRYSWQAVCKLPFIEESHLLAEIAKVDHTLTDEERQRNCLGLDVLFLHVGHPLATKIVSSYNRNKDHPKLSKGKVKRKIDPEISGGMNGYAFIHDKTGCFPEICSPVKDMMDISNHQIVSVFYKCPPFHPHIPRPPEGVCIPRRSVSKKNVLSMPVLWHEKTAVLGRLFSERNVPNSISGPWLARLAHRLVSQYYLEKKKGIPESACIPCSMLCDAEETDCRVETNGVRLYASFEPRKKKRGGEKARSRKMKRSGELKKTSAGSVYISENLLHDSEKTSCKAKRKGESLSTLRETRKRKRSDRKKNGTESTLTPNTMSYM